MKYMSKEEREAHAKAATAVFSEPVWKESLAAFYNNIRQFMPTFSSRDEGVLWFIVQQFVTSTAIVARLQALGIDPDSARQPKEEVQAFQEAVQAKHPHAKVMPYIGGPRSGK